MLLVTDGVPTGGDYGISTSHLCDNPSDSSSSWPTQFQQLWARRLTFVGQDRAEWDAVTATHYRTTNWELTSVEGLLSPLGITFVASLVGLTQENAIEDYFNCFAKTTKCHSQKYQHLCCKNYVLLFLFLVFLRMSIKILYHPPKNQHHNIHQVFYTSCFFVFVTFIYFYIVSFPLNPWCCENTPKKRN